MPFRAWVQTLSRTRQDDFADPAIAKKLPDKPIPLPTELPPVPDDCVRMALWLYTPNAVDVDTMKRRLASPEDRQKLFEAQAKQDHRFTREILTGAFDVTAAAPRYISFTAEMEPAHTAGLPDRSNEPLAKSCAVLCLVDVPLELPVLEETLATQGRSNKRPPPPPNAFGVYGVLRRPFEGDYYTATADGVVACNYGKLHTCSKLSYERTRARMGFQVVPSTQIFLSTALTATHVHPVYVYHYSRAELAPDTPTPKKKLPATPTRRGA